MGTKKDMPSKEELYSKYIDDNMRKDELSSFYGVSVSVIGRWLSFYGIKKDREKAQEAIKRSIIEKYGSKEALAAQSLKKRKKTCIERYGVDNVSKRDDVVAQIKESLSEHFSKPSKEEFEKYYRLQNHSLEKCAEKFEVHSSTALRWAKEFNLFKSKEEIVECRKKTCLEKYGCEMPLLNDGVRDKSVATVRAKYGVDNVFSSDEIKKKIANTNLMKYGVESPMQNQNGRNRLKESLREKYGVEYAGQVHADKKAVEVLSSKKSLCEFIVSHFPDHKPTIIEVSQALNCSETAVGHKINGWKIQDLIGYSTFLPEEEIKKFLEGLKVPFVEHDRSILSGKEIDFYIPSKNLGIEFNGSYWHSEVKKSPLYHQEKSLKATEKGVFIFNVFEYEWVNASKKEKILGMLRELVLDGEMRRIYARNTIIKTVGKKEKKAFLNENHLQGNDRSSICYGLYDGNCLVSLMSFCKPRFSAAGDWEVSRYCAKRGVRVVGGASKLFSHFLKNNADVGQKIISYSDIAKTRGHLYENLGFVLDHISKPNYVWWKRGAEILSRYSCQMKNEDKIMHDRGYKRIFDSGNKVWVYSVK